MKILNNDSNFDDVRSESVQGHITEGSITQLELTIYKRLTFFPSSYQLQRYIHNNVSCYSARGDYGTLWLVLSNVITTNREINLVLVENHNF